MYIDTVPNRHSPPAILLREARREGRRILKKTLLNLSHWPPEQVEGLRRLLRGEQLVSLDQLLEIEQSRPHGQVEAILGVLRKLGIDQLISPTPGRSRDLVLAMLAQRLIHPGSKLAHLRDWGQTTLAEELRVANAQVEELYDALDWLLDRQARIEKKLAQRHLSEGALVLYDVSSSYYEGVVCPLAQFGHNRDEKKGMRIIVYGLLTDREGRPVAVDVYEGSTSDPETVPDQMERLRKRFQLERVVLVADRGLLTETQVRKLREYPPMGWITALRSAAIRKLVDQHHLQLSLFDDQDLAEIHSPDYPGERLLACYNPLLAEKRRRKREELLQATEEKLDGLVRQVERRTKTPLEKGEIGVKAGRILGQYKMAKHYELLIEDGRFQWKRRAENIRREQELDGIYVIRTIEPKTRLSPEEAVRCYKSLSQVEQAFRTLKGVDLRIRPIRHWTVDHVKAHIFLCMLAYYVEWHMRRAWAPLLFEDEELAENRQQRDPVAPARPSASARAKKASKRTPEGFPVHSFQSLIQALGTRCRNTCKFKHGSAETVSRVLTNPDPLQQRAFQLLGLVPSKS